MRVRMKLSISGTRDGADWPPAGETIDVPADEAVALLNAGIAEPVEDTATETAAVEPPKRTPRPRGRKD